MSDKLEFPSKQGFHIFMKRLEKNKPNNQFNRICKILEILGYELILKKKGE
uniref:Hydrolase n=1 Tax=Siphoviridae sp. ct6rT12 TaxID=2825346 RepID=A0A8S5V9S8_9CAUD|nr:MAG TPA: hydrolase [Siphoviridae sp. ct6rT12]